MDIKELAEQAGLSEWRYEYAEKEFERFAELIRDDERDKCAQEYLQDCIDSIDAATLEEREACAALCETTSRENALKHYSALTYIQSAGECANAIRSRK